MTTNYAAPMMARGVLAKYRHTYRASYEMQKAMWSKIADVGVTTSEFRSLYAYAKNQRHPSRTEWGVAPFRRPMEYVLYVAEQYRFTSAVDILERDVMYSKLGGIDSDAKTAGDNFALLPERLLTQTMTATTDADLLPVIPVAPDLAAMYSATAGDGSDRFGRVGGNVVGGQILSTGAGMRAAVAEGIEAFQYFQDTEGQPFMSAALLKQGLTLMYPPSLHRQFMEAFIQTHTMQSGTPGDGPVSNYLTDAGYKINGFANPRLTAETACFLFIDGAPIKPLVELVGMPLRSQYYQRGNSKDFGEAGMMGWIFEKHATVLMNLPLYTLRLQTAA